MRLLVLLFSAFLSGCAGVGYYAVNVDSLASDDALDYKTYVILPSLAVAPGLEFDSYASQVQSALETKGLIRVERPSDADAFVLLHYEVGQPYTSNYTTSVPQWGQTGYSGSNTYATVVGNTITGNTTYTPTYGITGYQQISNSLTIHPLRVSLTAGTTEGLGENNSRQLWTTSITASSRRPDLRSAFPAMLYAAQPYLATDSYGMKAVKVPRSAFPDAR